jgi:nucleoside-diphosphate-sugar epimerase
LIYHCAGYGQPIKFVENPFATVEVNTSDLVFVAKLLKTNGKMFYLSSSEIYTNCKVEKPSEQDIGTVRTDHERAIYIGSKLLGESICWNLRRLGKNIIILRVSLVFGPGTKLNDQRVLNELILRGIRNRKVNVLDDGSAIRNYLSVEQCIYWIVCLTNSNKNYIYNISGNHKLTIRELARLISEILEVKIEVGEKKALMAAPQLVEINNNRINSEYPVSDVENLKLKITEVIDWYRKIIND